MSKIDPTRLSIVLAALAKPKERVSSTGAPKTSMDKVAKGGKDLDVLRLRLKERLQALDPLADTFHQAAPVVTVQEILRWEFGETILQHPEFTRISTEVAFVMLEDSGLNKAILGIVEKMLGEH